MVLREEEDVKAYSEAKQSDMGFEARILLRFDENLNATMCETFCHVFPMRRPTNPLVRQLSQPPAPTTWISYTISRRARDERGDSWCTDSIEQLMAPP